MLPILSISRNLQSGLRDPRFRNKLCRNSWVWGVKNSSHKNVCSVLLQKPTYLSSLEQDSVCMRRHPHCSVSWERQDPLSAPNVHVALPGPPAHPLGKHTGLGFPLGGGSCWETPALSLSPGRRRKLLCPGDWAVPWRQACYCKQTAQVQVKPYPGRVRDESEKNKLK